jgi:formate C-acetyltransferase
MYFEPLDDAKSFDEVYGIVLRNIRTLLEERLRVLRSGAGIWPQVDVLPIFSSTMQCCLEKRKDLTEGGGKYRDDRNEIFAFGNVADSLMAIKELCFDTKKYTLKEYLEAVRNNWEGCEDMRIDATRCHGWGDGNKDSSALAARLNSDMDQILQENTGVYGGKIVLAHFGYTEVRWWGAVTRATPDGRKNGDYLSQGLTPSRLTKIPHVTSVINSLTKLDASLFGGSSVVNIILPSTRMTLDSLEAFLRASAKSALQSLQLNCTSREQLLDAQKHPENYPDLVVRVTGFSAKFTSLSPEWQEEFLTRNFYE